MSVLPVWTCVNAINLILRREGWLFFFYFHFRDITASSVLTSRHHDNLNVNNRERWQTEICRVSSILQEIGENMICRSKGKKSLSLTRFKQDKERNLPGPGCSKLTTSLVNVSLKFQNLYLKCANIFCWENVRSFCNAKASHIFSTKNISVFGYKVVKHLTSWPHNELVKLTMLWTTGPRMPMELIYPFNISTSLQSKGTKSHSRENQRYLV